MDHKISTSNPRYVHGYLRYLCENCGSSFRILLEIGVLDHGEYGRETQPCPYCVECPYCGGLACDTMLDIVPIDPIRAAEPNEFVFAYDDSEDERDCGKFIKIPYNNFVSALSETLEDTMKLFMSFCETFYEEVVEYFYSIIVFDCQKKRVKDYFPIKRKIFVIKNKVRFWYRKCANDCC